MSPSLLAKALLLQAHDQVSDEEARERADFYIRLKVAPGIASDEQPFAKSTLQFSRSRVVLHQTIRDIFQRSLQSARQTGYVKSHRLKIALGTSYILGRGAVVLAFLPASLLSLKYLD